MKNIKIILISCIMMIGSLLVAFETKQAQMTGVIFNQGNSAMNIPFELSNNLICLQVRVNGSEPAVFILDTGAGFNVIDSAFAAGIGLDLSKRQVSKRTGASYSQLSGLTFSLPGLEARGQTGKVQPLAMLSPFAGVPIAGILGYDFIKHFVFKIDYARARICFYDPKEFRYQGKGEQVPFELAPDLNWPVITVRIDPEKGEPRDIRLLIDTGAIGPLQINIPDLCRTTIPNTVTMGITGSGMGGVVGRMKSVSFGRTPLEFPLAVMPEAAAGETEDPIAKAVGQVSQGNFGGEIMRRFTVTFDYPNKLMILEPNRDFKKTMEHDMCGTFIIDQYQPVRGFQVLAVTPGSPAEKAGIQTGDLITSINGKEAGKVSLSQAKDLFRHDGKKITLAVRRGEQTLEIKFKLQRMI
ncbi:aspartyl protease family protein [candidate division TA06 bacterium]|nr:aspartyl protease family protein [candidate division TA06 bacterium]